MAAPRVEPAAPTDAEDIAALHVASWRRAYSGLLPKSFLDGLDLETRRAEWQERLALPHGDDTFVLVSRDLDGRPAGFASAGGSRDEDGKGDGEVYALYVRPGLERRGHGSALLASALEALWLASYASVALWVADHNSDARTFYERANWFTDGARRSVLLPGAPWPLPAVRYRAPTP